MSVGSEHADVAVVTGGASGFGLALGTQCAQRGMSVVLLDRDGDRAQTLAQELASQHGTDGFGLAVDVANADDVSRAAGVVRDRLGRADLVLSNVGVQLFGATERLTDDEWRWVLDVNVIGAARVARSFLPLLRQAARPRIAFTTSSSVLSPASNMAAYQASKFGLWGLAETLRLELAGEQISVSVVFPSGMISRHLETSAEAQPENVRRAVAEPADFEAMFASNPGMARDTATPEEAAANVIDALIRGERYIITHGDLSDALDERRVALEHAQAIARADGKTVDS